MTRSESLDERQLVDVIADACAVSARNGVLELAGFAISLRRRVIEVERRLDNDLAATRTRGLLSFASNSEYRAWCASNKPRYRVRARSAPYP